MNNNTEIFILIMVALLHLIVLIVFFTMAGNVAKIKNSLSMNAKKYIEKSDCSI